MTQYVIDDSLELYLDYCKSVIMDEVDRLIQAASAESSEELKEALTIMAIRTFVHAGTSLTASHSTHEEARNYLQDILNVLNEAIKLEKGGIKKSDSPWGQVR